MGEGRKQGSGTRRRGPHTVLVAGPPGELARIEVRRLEPAEHLFRRLLGAYLAGYRGMVVEEIPRLSSVTRGVVREFEHRTIGSRVVLEAGDTVRIASTGHSESSTPDAGLEELGRMVTAFHRRVRESWQALPVHDERSWQEEDDRIDTIAWSILRSISTVQGIGLGGRSALVSGVSVYALEKIGDAAVELGRVAPQIAELASGNEHRAAVEYLYDRSLGHLEGALAARDDASANALLDVGGALLTSAQVVAESLVPALGQGTLSPASAVSLGTALRAMATLVGSSQELLHVALDKPSSPRLARSGRSEDYVGAPAA